MSRTLSILLAASLVGCGAYENFEVELQSERCAELVLSGAIEAQLQQGEPAVLTARVPSADAEHFELATDGPLQVTYKQDGVVELQITCPAVYNISLMGAAALASAAQSQVPLQKLAVYGSSRYAGPEVSGGVLEIRGAGQGQIHIEAVDVESLQVLLSGQARAAISGRAEQTSVEMTGQSQLEARSLVSQKVEVEGKGQSSAAVTATAHLGGRLRGEAEVIYAGNPDIAVTVMDQAQLVADP